MFSGTVIPVVCALIQKRGQLLFALRPPDKHLPLKWEFPGGKVEAGESPEEAVVREIREELACNIEILYPLEPIMHAYPDKLIRLIPFVSRLAKHSPEPTNKEHLALCWLSGSELKNINLAQADRRLLEAYLDKTSY